MHDEGKSLRVIAEMLDDYGIAPKRAKRWLHSSVLRIVSQAALRKKLALRFSLPDARHVAWSWLPECVVPLWTFEDDRFLRRQDRKQARLDNW